MTGQVTELRNVRTADNGNTDRAMRAPTIKLKSMPGKPLGIDMEPIDALRRSRLFGQLPGRNKLRPVAGCWFHLFPEIKFILSCCEAL